MEEKVLANSNTQLDPNLDVLMKEAFLLGEKARLISPPNPWVGALVIKNGRIVGSGYTQVPGGHHAEIVALNEAQNNAQGGTLIVTLEPCSHFGRTPPCSQAILKAGIKKVVIGILDPDPLVSGKGISELQRGGIEVEVGRLEKEISASLHPYIHHRTSGYPFVVGKLGLSLDGKMTDAKGASKWITSESARVRVSAIRAASQAIIVGSETFIRDQPKLNVRFPPFPHKQPLRVVIDRRGRLKDPNVDLHIQETNLRKILEDLGKRGVLQVMIEGGAELLSSFIKEALVDLLYTHINGRIFGGGTCLPIIDEIISPSRFIPTSTALYGDTVEVVWERNKPSVA